MTLCELYKRIGDLIMEGYGDHEVDRAATDDGPSDSVTAVNVYKFKQGKSVTEYVVVE